MAGLGEQLVRLPGAGGADLRALLLGEVEDLADPLAQRVPGRAAGLELLTRLLGVGGGLRGARLRRLPGLLGFVNTLFQPREVAVDLFTVVTATDEVEDGTALVRAAPRQQVGVLAHVTHCATMRPPLQASDTRFSGKPRVGG